MQHIFNEMDANDEERKERKKEKELLNTIEGQMWLAPDDGVSTGTNN